jgi:3-methyladenine DNA glycosylase Tag
MDDVVYELTKEQRNYWKERAERLLETNESLVRRIDRLRAIINNAQLALDSQSDARAEQK